MLRKFALLGALVFASTTFAAGNKIGAILGFDNVAKITLGADFEHEIERSLGFGGALRIWTKDDSASSPAGRTQNGMFILTGNMRIHFPQKRWDFSVAPGVSIISISPASSALDDSTTLGPALALTATYELTPTFSLGMEYGNYWVWLDEDYAGKVADDATIKGVFSF